VTSPHSTSVPSGDQVAATFSARNVKDGSRRSVDAKFVFIGAGGGALHLLQASGENPGVEVGHRHRRRADRGLAVGLGEVQRRDVRVDGSWRVTARNVKDGSRRSVDAKFVFIGAGGGALHPRPSRCAR
jgi:L-2-hydroxyglutarate oxidase LhgO